MIRRKKTISIFLILAMALSISGGMYKTAFAGEYSSCLKKPFSNDYVERGVAIDSNGLSWSYVKLDDGTISLDGTNKIQYDANGKLVAGEGADNLPSVFEIPETLDGYKVTCIQNIVGYENKILFGYTKGNSVKKVIIPEGVREIGRGAFARCPNLTDINIPSTVKIIGQEAFHQSWLNAHRNSDGFVIINDILVDGHKADGDITIPDNIKCIGDGAFACGTYGLYGDIIPGCENVTSVKIPSSVKRIGKNAFYRCNLEKVSIPEGVEVIDDEAFAECNKLIEVNIPKSVTEISSTAFGYGGNIKLSGPGAEFAKNQKENSNSANSNESEKIKQGWNHIGDNWYYGNSDGTKKTGWLYDGGSWYYFYGNGQMATGFIDLNGAYYYLDETSTSSIGTMKTGWQKINESWYYFNTSSDDGLEGMMNKGWKLIGGSWYYFYYDDGTMAHDTWIGNYYVNSSGAWVY